MSSLKTVSTDRFDLDVMQSPLPVLVDFYADYCGPCRRLGPTLQRLAQEFAGRVEIVKVDVVADPALARRFRVESIPQLLFVAGGRIVEQSTGAPPEAVLRDSLERLAGHAKSPTRPKA